MLSEHTVENSASIPPDWMGRDVVLVYRGATLVPQPNGGLGLHFQSEVGKVVSDKGAGFFEFQPDGMHEKHLVHVSAVHKLAPHTQIKRVNGGILV